MVQTSPHHPEQKYNISNQITRLDVGNNDTAALFIQMITTALAYAALAVLLCMWGED